MKHILSFNFGWGFRLRSDCYCKHHPPSEHCSVCPTVPSSPQSAEDTAFFIERWTFLFSHLLHTQLERLEVSVIVWFIAAARRLRFHIFRHSLNGTKHTRSLCAWKSIPTIIEYFQYFSFKLKFSLAEINNNAYSQNWHSLTIFMKN